MNVLDKVKAIVAEHHKMDPNDLTPDTHFVDDLGESLDYVEVIIACEEAFGLSIPDEDAEKTGTIGQLAAYIEDRLTKSDK